MVRFSSSSIYYMFLLGTFLSSNVPEPDHQPQTDVVFYANLLFAYTPDLIPAIVPSPGCEVPSSPL
jgi:hypothetical protein